VLPTADWNIQFSDVIKVSLEFGQLDPIPWGGEGTGHHKIRD
jgi:hypothetical protein